MNTMSGFGNQLIKAQPEATPSSSATFGPLLHDYAMPEVAIAHFGASRRADNIAVVRLIGDLRLKFAAEPVRFHEEKVKIWYALMHVAGDAAHWRFQRMNKYADDPCYGFANIQALFDELISIFGRTSAEAQLELTQLTFDMNKDSARKHMLYFESVYGDIRDELFPHDNRHKARQFCRTLVNKDLRGYMIDMMLPFALNAPDRFELFRDWFFEYVEDYHKEKQVDAQGDQQQQGHGARGHHQRGRGRGRGRGQSQTQFSGASP